MIANNNSALSLEIRDVLKLQNGRDQFPQLVENKIVPVIDVNHKHARIARLLAATTRSTTASAVSLMAAKPNQDVYITAIEFANSQDATSDNVVMFINGTINGASVSLYRRNKQTTTAGSFLDMIRFQPEVKLDRNTALTFTLAFTAGASDTSIEVWGYTEDNPNA